MKQQFAVKKNASNISNPWLMQVCGKYCYGPSELLFTDHGGQIQFITFPSKEAAQQFIDTHPEICNKAENVICEIVAGVDTITFVPVT